MKKILGALCVSCFALNAHAGVSITVAEYAGFLGASDKQVALAGTSILAGMIMAIADEPHVCVRSEQLPGLIAGLSKAAVDYGAQNGEVAKTLPLSEVVRKHLKATHGC